MRQKKVDCEYNSRYTDTYKVIANAKVSLRERHEKRIEDGEGATLLKCVK